MDVVFRIKGCFGVLEYVKSGKLEYVSATIPRCLSDGDGECLNLGEETRKAYIGIQVHKFHYFFFQIILVSV